MSGRSGSTPSSHVSHASLFIDGFLVSLRSTSPAEKIYLYQLKYLYLSKIYMQFKAEPSIIHTTSIIFWVSCVIPYSCLRLQTKIKQPIDVRPPEKRSQDASTHFSAHTKAFHACEIIASILPALSTDENRELMACLINAGFCDLGLFWFYPWQGLL